jgi:hypothetical protein
MRCMRSLRCDFLKIGVFYSQDSTLELRSSSGEFSILLGTFSGVGALRVHIC